MKLKIVVGCLVVGVVFYGFFFVARTSPELVAQNMLDQADIKINGTRPQDIIIKNDKVYQRVMQQGSLGLGEAYMDGWWDCPALDQFFYALMRAQLDKTVTLSWAELFEIMRSMITNIQTKQGSLKVAQEHYDLGNDLFECMLDKHMIYSCAYWKNASTIDEAQEQKLDLICKKLQLKPGMTLLDIGCGWGGLAYFAAKNYGAQVTGITISKEQALYAQELCKNLPVTIVLKDYRDLNEKFDRVVSVGMFEHVGYKNYREFMEVAANCLHDEGIFLLHTIGSNASYVSSDPWLSKYIFPNSMLPSLCQIGKSMEGIFVMEDWHNLSTHYDKTLMAWHERFNKNWQQLKDSYDDRFYRMWNYYLLSCAGAFRARAIQLWQIVLSKQGVLGGYTSVR